MVWVGDLGAEGKVRAVALNSPPCQEAWALPCTLFLNMHLARVSQIQHESQRDLGLTHPSGSQPFSVLAFQGKEEKLLSLNKSPKPSTIGKPWVRRLVIAPLGGCPQQVS